MRPASILACLALLLVASTAHAESPTDAPAAPPDDTRGDLFPEAGQLSASAATGLPFVGIAEGGVGITNGVAAGVVGGITPTGLWTLGVRPRFRVATGERTALVLVTPILYYPRGAEAPGQTSDAPWMLARVELSFDTRIGARWHASGGMGLIGVASTEALGQVLRGDSPKLPAYDGNPDAKRGVAGGLFNTVAARGSYALDERTRLFAEASLVLEGVKPAKDVGGLPLVTNVGVQRAF